MLDCEEGSGSRSEPQIQSPKNVKKTFVLTDVILHLPHWDVVVACEISAFHYSTQKSHIGVDVELVNNFVCTLS